MIRNKAQALAHNTGMDVTELKDYRYHYGRTSKPIWSIDNQYYCVTLLNESPANHRDGMVFEWVKLTDNFAAHYGYQIWISN